jgi:death on curing protein
VTVRDPTLEDYLHTAFVLGLPVETIVKAVSLDLAESALHAPQASWGGVDFYPSFAMKAAELLVRLTKNHALPDGNKRIALATTIAFCDVNGFDWLPPAGVIPQEIGITPNPQRGFGVVLSWRAMGWMGW